MKIDKAVNEFINSVKTNANAVRLAEPAWLKEQREKNLLMAQRLEWNRSCETEAQRKIRVFNEWEEILSE